MLFVTVKMQFIPAKMLFVTAEMQFIPQELTCGVFFVIV